MYDNKTVFSQWAKWSVWMNYRTDVLFCIHSDVLSISKCVNISDSCFNAFSHPVSVDRERHSDRKGIRPVYSVHKSSRFETWHNQESSWKLAIKQKSKVFVGSRCYFQWSSSAVRLFIGDSVCCYFLVRPLLMSLWRWTVYVRCTLSRLRSAWHRCRTTRTSWSCCAKASTAGLSGSTDIGWNAARTRTEPLCLRVTLNAT